MEGVLESMAEYYSRQLRTNIKRGHLYNAQKQLTQNKRQGGQRVNGLTSDETPRFWLTGKFYCDKCGTPQI